MPDVIEYKILFMKKFKMQQSQKFVPQKFLNGSYVWQVYIINEKCYVATVLVLRQERYVTKDEVHYLYYTVLYCQKSYDLYRVCRTLTLW